MKLHIHIFVRWKTANGSEGLRHLPTKLVLQLLSGKTGPDGGVAEDGQKAEWPSGRASAALEICMDKAALRMESREVWLRTGFLNSKLHVSGAGTKQCIGWKLVSTPGMSRPSRPELFGLHN